MRLYDVWKCMRYRCENPNRKEYPRYGGRGIKVCERWAKFANFEADMGQAPPGLTLDRIDNDGDYEPSNCRWATRSMQVRNGSGAKRITFNGETKCLAEWEAGLGLSQGTISHRLKNGWPTDRALTTPNRSRP